MEDNQLPVSNDGQCIECNTNPPLSGYPIALCADCRNTFNKYPIPKWLWFFAAGILLLLITGLIRMPSSLEAGVHLRRAEKAIEQHKYLTARRETDKVLKNFPDLIAANGYKLIASTYIARMDAEAMDEAYQKLQGKKIDDTDLLNRINEAMAYTEQLIPTDTQLLKRVDGFINYAPAIQENFLDSIYKGARDPDRALFGYKLASLLYERKDYTTCIAVLDKTMPLLNGNYYPYSLLIGAKRNAHRYEEALSLCDTLLAASSENVWAIAQKSKLHLSLKHTKEATAYATAAMALDSLDTAALEAQALIDFSSGRKAESNKLLARIRQLEPAIGDTVISDRLSKILDGTTTYQ